MSKSKKRQPPPDPRTLALQLAADAMGDTILKAAGSTAPALCAALADGLEQHAREHLELQEAKVVLEAANDVLVAQTEMLSQRNTYLGCYIQKDRRESVEAINALNGFPPDPPPGTTEPRTAGQHSAIIQERLLDAEARQASDAADIQIIRQRAAAASQRAATAPPKRTDPRIFSFAPDPPSSLAAFNQFPPAPPRPPVVRHSNGHQTLKGEYMAPHDLIDPQFPEELP